MKLTLNTVKDIKKKISDLNEEILNIQSKCPHPEEYLIREQVNHDPDVAHGLSPYRWDECHCTLCDVTWTQEVVG